MTRENRLARLFRALSELSQHRFARRAGLHPGAVGAYELGRQVPPRDHLERMSGAVDLTVEAGDEILRHAEALGRSRQRAGMGMAALTEPLAAVAGAAYQRLLRAPRPPEPPRPEDRQLAAEQWARLQALAPAERTVAVGFAAEFHLWALAERLCTESETACSKDLEEAAHLAGLAREILARVEGPEGWLRRLAGLVAGYAANVERVAGRLDAARRGLAEAWRLWKAGDDPYGLLDPGRLLDLEASLRRAERRFDEALRLLAEAFEVSPARARILVKKGFTLEVMGEYERAAEALRQAEPFLDRAAEPRLYYMQRFNLAVLLTHVERYAEASALLQEVRGLLAARGEENEQSRMIWLEGRIAAGLGRREEALARLGEARRRFAARTMSYDVALAFLEEAVLLLEAGRAAEVRALAADLQTVFEAQGVHREALAALKLFHEAAGREEASAPLARRVLAYLFRARHDEGLAFGAG